MNDPIRNESLVNFLKQYRPILPEKQPDLENQIMAAIEEDSSGLETEKGKRKKSLLLSLWAQEQDKKYKRFWMFSPAIAASLLVAWSGYHTLNPTKLSPSEEAHLEAFLVSNWDGSFGESNLLPLSLTIDN